ncbi:DMT family transporter [Falsiroseomonas oryziterrae]|uniref:DMT family transporter n=1 Tax=Falsiroseomonas oryziterrae TaxID=2911368 RepID=UPI001F176CEE|nr:DMT family transporter [Roseomonas sp. NPKOSM-4]
MSPMAKAGLLAVGSAFLFTLETVVVKAIEGVPLATIVLARSLGQLAWTLPAFLRDPAGLVQTGQLKLNLFRGLLSGVSWYMYFLAFTTLPLAAATVLSFTSVLFVTALAGPVLGERVRWRRWSATLVGFLGVLAIVRPGAVEIGWPVVAAIGAAFLGAGIVLTTKMLARSERTGTIMFYIGVMTTALSLPFAIPVLAWPGWWNAALLLGTAMCGPFAMHLWINALRLADASVVAPISYVRLVFAAGFGIALFGEVPDAWLWLGAALIVGSALYITQREAKVAQRKAAPLAPAPLVPQPVKPDAAIAASSGDVPKPKSR